MDSLKIEIIGPVETVRATLRTVLLDVPGAAPEHLSTFGDGTARVTVDIPAGHEDLAARIVAAAAAG